jgi:hypothetical protein
LETRVLYVGTGSAYGVTYRWRADGSEADLMTGLLGTSEDITIATAGGGTRVQTWFYPGRDDCMRCHTAAAGFVLGPKTRQLNTPYRYPSSGVIDNQLRTWNYLQMFASPLSEAAIPGYDRLAAVDDAGVTLEHRVRSYLDSNCGNCHRPGSTSMGRSQWDGRFDTPLSSQGIVEGTVFADSLGIPNPFVVASGDPARSVLLSRMARTDTYRMPALGSSVVDTEAVLTITAWINTLTPPGGGGPTPPPGGGGPTPPGGGTPAGTPVPQGDDQDGVDEKCLHGAVASGAPGALAWVLALVLLAAACRRS